MQRGSIDERKLSKRPQVGERRNLHIDIQPQPDKLAAAPCRNARVNAGLGYFILDTRDRMAYGELMACVLFIGLLGFALDWLARLAHRRRSGA